MIKHRGQGSEQKEGFTWLAVVGRGMEAASMHGGWGGKLRAHFLNHKQEMERELGTAQIFHSQCCLQGHVSSNKSTLSKLPPNN